MSDREFRRLTERFLYNLMEIQSQVGNMPESAGRNRCLAELRPLSRAERTAHPLEKAKRLSLIAKSLNVVARSEVVGGPPIWASIERGTKFIASELDKRIIDMERFYGRG